MTRPRVLLLGSTGLLGQELLRALTPRAEVVTSSRAPGAALRADLLDPASLEAAVARTRPAVVVNAAGFAAVDEAEREPERVHALNAVAPGALAQACAHTGALLVHWSTDYVFDGALRRPYREDDVTNPLSVYGRTKLAGEEAVRASGAAHLVLRTSWLYPRRGRGFVATMEGRLKGEREVDVLADQHGSPTWARIPAEACRDVLARLVPFAGPEGLDPRVVSGLYHVACGGPATWLEVACALAEHWGSDATLTPKARVPGAGVAARPAWSPLDAERVARVFGVYLPTWREGLARCLAESG